MLKTIKDLITKDELKATMRLAKEFKGLSLDKYLFFKKIATVAAFKCRRFGYVDYDNFIRKAWVAYEKYKSPYYIYNFKFSRCCRIFGLNKYDIEGLKYNELVLLLRRMNAEHVSECYNADDFLN